MLDENLYCYDNVVFTLTPAIQKGASDTDYYEKNLSVRCTFEIMYQDIHIKLRTQVEPVTT